MGHWIGRDDGGVWIGAPDVPPGRAVVTGDALKSAPVGVDLSVMDTPARMPSASMEFPERTHPPRSIHKLSTRRGAIP